MGVMISEKMGIGHNGIHDLGVVIVRGGDVRHGNSTLCVSCRQCVAGVIHPKDEAHVAGSLTPEFKLTREILLLLCMNNWIQSGCLRSSWNICG